MKDLAINFENVEVISIILFYDPTYVSKEKQLALKIHNTKMYQLAIIRDSRLSPSTPQESFVSCFVYQYFWGRATIENT